MAAVKPKAPSFSLVLPKKEAIPSPPTSSPPSTPKKTVAMEELMRVNCPFASEQHEGKEFLNILLPLQPKEVFRLIFEDEELIRNIYKEKNYVDMVYTAWEKNAETGDTIRTLNCTANLPSKALGPSTSNVTENHVLSASSRDNELYIVNTTVTNNGIPYSDNFRIHVHVCLTKEISDVSNIPQCRLNYFCNVKFKKNTFFLVKGLIEKSSYEGIQAIAEDIGSTLSTEGEKMNGNEGKKKSKRRKESEMNGAQTSKKAESISNEKSSSLCSWSALFLFTLLLSIAVMNGYLFFELKQIEKIASTRQVLIGEKDLTPESLTKPPSTQAIEDSLKEMKVREELMKNHFEKWKERLNIIFESINAAETELLEIIKYLPDYESELLEMLSFTSPSAAEERPDQRPFEEASGDAQGSNSGQEN